MKRLEWNARRLRDGYLRRLRRSLAACPSVDRQEVERDVREHIEMELADAPEPVSRRALERVLEQLGNPAQWVTAECPGLQPGGTGMGLPAGFSAAQAQSSLSPIGSSHQRWPQHQVSRANLHTLQHAAAVQAGQRLPQLPQGHDSRMHGMQAQLSVQQSTQIPMHPGFMRTELPQKPEPSQQQRALEDDLVALHVRHEKR